MLLEMQEPLTQAVVVVLLQELQVVFEMVALAVLELSLFVIHAHR
jgi:hypothetical protein